MVMFFSPECDHCKHQTRDILEVSDKFKDIENCNGNLSAVQRNERRSIKTFT